MSCACGCGRPRASCGKGFTVLSAQGLACTLAGQLAPVADELRDLATQFGIRPYQVVLVRTRWTGGARGNGTEEVLTATPLLPTPRVVGPDGLAVTLQIMGSNEDGLVTVDRIATCYTEDALYGRGEFGAAIPKDEGFWWELRFPQLDGTTIHRRFAVASPPILQPDKAQWMVRLRKSNQDRARDGAVRGLP